MKPFKAIDFHTHVFPDRVAGTALQFLSGKSGSAPFSDGTAAGLLAGMDRARIDLSVNMPVATHPSQVASINRWCASLETGRMRSFASYHPALDDLSVVRGIARSGFKGIKLHPEFQCFSPDDPSLLPLWKACADNGLWVFFHAGADFAFSPPFKSSPAKFARLRRMVPGLRMILAHFGSWRMWDETEKELVGDDVVLETSFTLGFIPDALFVELVRKHGTKKVVFGSDSPWRGQGEELEKIRSLGFGGDELDSILWRNAAEMLGINTEGKCNGSA